MKGKNKIGTWVGFILILLWCLFPVAWILSLSFKSEGETSVGSPQFLPQDPTFDNYSAIVDNPDFRQSLINSFGISLISTLLSVIFATFAADRKSTRLNSSHSQISYAVFCLKKKKYTTN